MVIRGAVLIHRTGQYLNRESAMALKQELLAALAQGQNQVVIDMTDTISVDSSGIGTLLLFQEKVTQLGGSFRLINIRQAKLVKLFRAINLDRFIRIEYSDN